MKLTLNNKHLNNASVNPSETYLQTNTYKGGMRRYDRQKNAAIGHYYFPVFLASTHLFTKEINEK